MRISTLYRSLLHRLALPAGRRGSPARHTLPGNLGRVVQDALEWDVNNRARRKRLGLE